VRKEVFDPDQICPLCGVEKAQHDGKCYVNRDHIPPRGVFVDLTDPNGLITVPSCENCNQKNSTRDEEFKVALAIQVCGHTDSQHPFLQSAFKTLRKNKRLYGEIDKGISSKPILTDLGWQHEVHVSEEALKIGLTKIVRGLHWHVAGEVLPAKAIPEIIRLEQGKSVDPQIAEVFKTFGQPIQKCGNQFEAIWGVPADVPHSSLWLLRFYGVDSFVVAFRPWRTTTANVAPATLASPASAETQ
jgi:hypothetical protein